MLFVHSHSALLVLQQDLFITRILYFSFTCWIMLPIHLKGARENSGTRRVLAVPAKRSWRKWFASNQGNRFRTNYTRRDFWIEKSIRNQDGIAEGNPDTMPRKPIEVRFTVEHCVVRFNTWPWKVQSNFSELHRWNSALNIGSSRFDFRFVEPDSFRTTTTTADHGGDVHDSINELLFGAAEENAHRSSERCHLSLHLTYRRCAEHHYYGFHLLGSPFRYSVAINISAVFSQNNV